MLTVADKQKYVMDKIREDEVILMSDLFLGDKVFSLAREGKTTDEILVWLWNNQYGEKYGLLPEAVNSFLKKRGLTAEMRKAIRNVPILEEVDKGLMEHVRFGNAKVLMFMKEKIDPDFKKQTEGNVTNIGKQITQINIQVVKPEDDTISVTPE